MEHLDLTSSFKLVNQAPQNLGKINQGVQRGTVLKMWPLLSLLPIPPLVVFSLVASLEGYRALDQSVKQSDSVKQTVREKTYTSAKPFCPIYQCLTRQLLSTSSSPLCPHRPGWLQSFVVETQRVAWVSQWGESSSPTEAAMATSWPGATSQRRPESPSSRRVSVKAKGPDKPMAQVLVTLL